MFDGGSRLNIYIYIYILNLNILYSFLITPARLTALAGRPIVGDGCLLVGFILIFEGLREMAFVLAEVVVVEVVGTLLLDS